MSKALAKSALSDGFLSSIRGMTKSVADDVAESFLKYSDDIAESVIRELNTTVLVNTIKSTFGDVTSSIVESIAKNSDDIATIARQGVDGLPLLVTKVSSDQAKVVLSGAEDLAKTGKLNSNTVDEGIKLGDDAAKADGGLVNWFKKNPKLAIVGLTVSGVGLYIGINALNGTSPSDSLNNILELPGNILSEIASLLVGLAASFIKGILPILLTLLAVGVGILVFLGIFRYVKNKMKKNKRLE